MPTLDLPPDWLEAVRRIVARHLPGAEVWAYGSRVRGTAHEGSDLDLVARNPADLEQPLSAIQELRKAFSESDLPILVEVLDWACVPESFRREIARDAVVISEGRDTER